VASKKGAKPIRELHLTPGSYTEIFTGSRRGVYLPLYVVLDLFSRFAVAWMVSRKENSALATQLMAEATARYLITPV
jgi:transposase InsO family protein